MLRVGTHNLPFYNLWLSLATWRSWGVVAVAFTFCDNRNVSKDFSSSPAPAEGSAEDEAGANASINSDENTTDNLAASSAPSSSSAPQPEPDQEASTAPATEPTPTTRNPLDTADSSQSAANQTVSDSANDTKDGANGDTDQSSTQNQKVTAAPRKQPFRSRRVRKVRDLQTGKVTTFLPQAALAGTYWRPVGGNAHIGVVTVPAAGLAVADLAGNSYSSLLANLDYFCRFCLFSLVCFGF